MMRTFGWTPTEEELKDLVNVIDVDGNGDISFNEFVWLMTKCVQTDGDENVFFKPCCNHVCFNWGFSSSMRRSCNC